jgi:anti-sigma factor RsiW
VRAKKDELCLRACEWASLRLDGELSEFEEAMLQAHLAGCVACSEFVRRIETVAEQVRFAPLEPFERSVVLARHRRISWRVSRAAAAGAAVVATIGLTSGLILRNSSLKIGPEPAIGSVDFTRSVESREFRILRAAQMRSPASVASLKVRSPVR